MIKNDNEISNMDLFNEVSDPTNRFKLINKFATRYMPEWFLPMLTDYARNDFYRLMIKHSVKDKVVIDLGAGTGMWTIESLAQGAKFVYVIEKNPVLINYLRFIFKDSQVKIFPKDFKDLKLADFDHGLPEVITHEIFSNTGLGEGLISAFQKASELFPEKNLNLIPRYIWVEARISKELPLELAQQEKDLLQDKVEAYYELIHSLGIRGWDNTNGVTFESDKPMNALFVDLLEVRKDGKYALDRIPVTITPGMVHRIYLSFKFAQNLEGPFFDTAFGQNHWGGLMVEFYASKSFPVSTKYLKLELEDNLLFKNPVLEDV